MQISAAGNTEVPAYLVLIAKGYEIIYRDPDDAWVAQKGEEVFALAVHLNSLVWLQWRRPAAATGAQPTPRSRPF
jgi:hypothetical protein